jgi:AraC-like DNA-binding protein
MPANAYESESLSASFRAGAAVIVRKHKSRQKPLAPGPRDIDHLYVVVAGELEIFKQGRWWPAPARTLTWLPRGVTYGIRQKPGYRGPVKVLIIQFLPPRSWMPTVGQTPTPVHEVWWRRLLDLESEAEFDAFGQRVVRMSAVMRFIARMSAATAAVARSAQAPKRTSTASDWLAIWTRSQDVIAERAAAGLTVEELARAVHVSVVQLRRIYGAVEARSPKAAVDAWRIIRAKKLLAAGAHSAAQVARLVGFSTAQRFSTAFKAACGMTPGKFAEEG